VLFRSAGFNAINQQIRFSDRVYPVNALATTVFDTTKLEATYTYWAVKSPRAGLGLTLGAAELTVDASLIAQTPDLTVTISQNAKTSVPVALAGAQTRIALSDRLIAEVAAAALPHVKIDVYSGRATSAGARLEYRVVRNAGIGIAYNYFDIDGTISDPSFGGRLKMTVKGAEGFVRVGF